MARTLKLCAQRASRLRVVVSQIGFLRFVGFAITKLGMRMFDPCLIASYSQFGEDRLIASIFKGRSTGFYVDVGSNHPVRFSNTWMLYRSGWRGICVDANPEMISLHKKMRPRDVAIQAAVSDERTSVDFYFSKASSLISGIGKKWQGKFQRTEDNADVVVMDTTPLGDLLREHDCPSRIDLLSIDVEGADLEVLRSIDLLEYSPVLIVIEMHDLDLADLSNSVVYKELFEKGYELVSYLRPSGFFAKRKTVHVD